MAGTPPRLSRALLSAALPVDVRSVVLRDLDEVFQRKAEADGIARANHWYRREARIFALRFTGERLGGIARSLRFSTLDVKLAARMVWKYPGITIVGGLAIMTAIAVTSAAFEITHNFSNPTLPLPGADRIVTLQLLDPETNRLEMRLLFELNQWREAPALETAGGYRNTARNLIVTEGHGELVPLAEMTASGFRVAGVAALLGRTLVDDDERAGAPAVAVVGYPLWKTAFNSDPNIVGRSFHLGATSYVVVGVMPEGFAFPVSHSLWTPLVRGDTPLARFDGSGIRAFARLRPSVSIDRASAELDAISRRAPLPAGERVVLRARAVPYVSGLIQPGLLKRTYLLQSLLFVVLLICCANVATLVFARTVTRQAEITVRTALGASRGRILSQFFAEALVLAVAGAVAGLFVANFSIQWVMQLTWSTGFAKPFWWHDGLASATYGYATLLTVLVAFVCGVIPALKGTRRGVNAALQSSAGRGTSATFGAGWTAIIILQVALIVVLLPVAMLQAWDGVHALPGPVGIAANEYVAAGLEFETDAADGVMKRAALFRDLAVRLAKEPDVTGVAFADGFPGMSAGRGLIDVDGDAAADPELSQSYTATVAPGFFEALHVSALTGRTFADDDVVAGRPVAIVNQLFVSRVLGGRNPIGRRVRFHSPDGSQPWLEIVGVVPDLGMNPLRPAEGAGIYRAAAPASERVHLIGVHVASGAASFGPRLRAIALAVNPELKVTGLTTLDQVGKADQLGFRFFAFAFVVVAFIGVVLSTTGIYSMMSFTVSRRTREIAIRAALGANPRRIVFAIFSRAAIQVGLGALAGVVLLVVARPQSAREIWLPIGLASFMCVVGVFACAAPARRALRIEPSDALKDVG